MRIYEKSDLPALFFTLRSVSIRKGFERWEKRTQTEKFGVIFAVEI